MSGSNLAETKHPVGHVLLWGCVAGGVVNALGHWGLIGILIPLVRPQEVNPIPS